MAICHRLNLVLDLLTFTNQLPDRKIFCGDISISEADTDVFFQWYSGISHAFKKPLF